MPPNETPYSEPLDNLLADGADDLGLGQRGLGVGTGAAFVGPLGRWARLVLSLVETTAVVVAAAVGEASTSAEAATGKTATAVVASAVAEASTVAEASAAAMVPTIVGLVAASVASSSPPASAAGGGFEEVVGEVVHFWAVFGLLEVRKS